MCLPDMSDLKKISPKTFEPHCVEDQGWDCNYIDMKYVPQGLSWEGWCEGGTI
jgi:hypothetical protein